MIRVVTATDPGRERDRNEDAVLAGSFDDGSWVVIVCDGMGGHEAGDVASKTAARRIYQEVNANLEDPDLAAVLARSLHAAHHQVSDDAAERQVDMGTTATVARIVGDQLVFAWVGDSRLYLFRDGQLVAHSVDHTIIQRLIEAGELDPDGDHEDHPDAHVLTQAIGGENVDLLPSVGEATLHPGDRVVLCSDGLHDLVSPDETASLLSGPFDDLADALVAEANRRGGHDNITVAVIGVEPGVGAEEGARASGQATPPPAPVPEAPSPPAPPSRTPPTPAAAAARTTPVEPPARRPDKPTAGRVTLPDEPLPSQPRTPARQAAAPPESPSASVSPRVVALVVAVAGAAALAAGLAVFLLMRSS